MSCPICHKNQISFPNIKPRKTISFSNSIKNQTPIPIQQYIAETMKGNKYRFLCECTFKIDMIGVIVDYKISGQEIIFMVQGDNGKIIPIGSNHPNLYISQL